MIGKLGDLANLMKNAKSIQQDMEAAQKELENKTVTGEAGAGLVTVEMNGKYRLLKTTIADELLSEEKTVIEDLISAAINDASRKVSKMLSESMSQLSGLFGGLGGSEG